MKVIAIVGARPQFIKAAPVSKVLSERGHDEILLHTGQHYDYEMSQIFFEELPIRKPDINLGIGSGSHAWQTSQMLIGIEKTLVKERPDWVLVYGDTNSTLAGALAACKLHISIAHIEAGLRSFNREMPEEHNRVLTDHCADALFCPTKTAVKNLAEEGITHGVYLVGDTMYDAILKFFEIANSRSKILDRLNLKNRKYFLATIHRAYNTDIEENLKNILYALMEINELIIFPIHPRTRKQITMLNGKYKNKLESSKIKIIEPISYLDMLVLEKHAKAILTDSGGMQKEAYFLNVPCITLRPETEWVETVETGWNQLVGTNPERILEAVSKLNYFDRPSPKLFGQGDAAQRIVNILEQKNYYDS